VTIKTRPLLAWSMAASAAIVASCGEPPPSEPAPPATTAELAEELGLSSVELRRILALGPLGEPPADPTNRFADDDEAAALGHALFFDARLSGDGSVSCATCHEPSKAFTDGLAVSVGTGDGTRNAPTVLDSAHQRWLTWDGRADSLWSQALQPMERSFEMDGDRTAIVRTTLSDPDLRATYESIFRPVPSVEWLDALPERARPLADDPNDPAVRAWGSLPEEDREIIDACFANLGKALAAYQRRLRGGETSLDRFVRGLKEGDRDALAALSPQARAGLRLFVGRAGCIQCHEGPMLSDGEFHLVGVPKPGGGMPSDAARFLGARIVKQDAFNAAGRHSDDPAGAAALRVSTLAVSPEAWGAFRTPSLRHVGRTAPYMHAGQMPDLESVIRFYSTLEGAVQLDHHREQVLVPLDLTEAETAALLAFLRSLDGPGPEPRWAEPPAR
jgi:cytochrome c peroxidase